jgi:hypothetical protein
MTCRNRCKSPSLRRAHAPTYISDEILKQIAETRKELEGRGIRTTRTPGKRDPATGNTLELGSRKGPRVHGPSWEAPDVADNVLCDGKTADRIVELLRQFKEEDTPFFLGCGFLKPHLPFVAPKRYFDLYPIESIELPNNRFYPKNVPQLALHKSGEFRAYWDVPANERERKLRMCTGHIDPEPSAVRSEVDRCRRSECARQSILTPFADHASSQRLNRLREQTRLA